MRDIINDISELTTIPTINLSKLMDKMSWCICDCVHSANLNHEDAAEMNIGIGKLIIKFDEEGIRYRFVPSKSLEESLKQVILKNNNPLEDIVEATLVDKIIKTYKDLF